MRNNLRKAVLLMSVWLVCLMGFCSMDVLAAGKTYTYYGSHLTGYQKQIYKSIRKNWADADVNVISVDSKGYSLEYAGMWVLNDYPQYFWCNTYSSGYGYGYFYFRMESWKNAVKQKAKFNKRVNSVVKSLKKKCKGKSTAEKAVILHDWVCKNCKYSKTSYDQSAYGVFVKKKAVCAGFARAYKLLCDKMGLKCICVNVLLNGVPHLTNYVKVGNSWYLVDCTNDQSPSGKPLRFFCLVGSGTIGADLSSSCGVRLPSLSATDYPLEDRLSSMYLSAKPMTGQYLYGNA